MTTIKIIEARFVEGDVSDVEERLKEFLKTLRKRKMAAGLLVTNGVMPEVDTIQLDDFGDDLMQGVDLSYNDMKKIRRRAAGRCQSNFLAAGRAAG